MKDRVTIIGLGCVGTSIGLALREQVADLEVVGHDLEPDHARRAAQMGAVSKTDWNLPAACEGAKLVILALPLPAVRETLEVLGPHLEEGCVVTDTALLKVPVLEWAREYLPEGVRFVAGAPIPSPTISERAVLTGPEAARADLFEGGLYCVTPARDTDPEAVSTLLDLARVLDAQPLFMEPLEFDGLQAGIGDLPALIAMALLRATVGSPGWMEMRKVAGFDFAAVTEPATADPGALRAAALLNRENLLRRLDMFLEELERIRQWLLESDEEALQEAYADAAAGRIRWLEERAGGTWEEKPGLGEVPGIGEQFERLLFGGLLRRRPRGGEK